jgi:OOP family OmpA-OmpF porin
LRRAQAVRQYLTSQGIPASLIDVATRGEAQPVATNGTPEGRARNRRAEVEFVGVRTR